MTLEVIGAGYPRTASLSLKLALERLGFGPCHHMTEVFARPERWSHWLNARAGKPVDWDAAFAGFRSTTDAPACFYSTQLAAHFPNAKVILAIRDAESWCDSAQQTVLSDRTRGLVAGTPVGDWLERAFYAHFGDGIADRSSLISLYQRHNNAIMRAVPKERLLVYETGSGWEPICRFLGVPVPAEPFPRANDRDDFVKRLHEEAAR